MMNTLRLQLHLRPKIPTNNQTTNSPQFIPITAKYKLTNFSSSSPSKVVNSTPKELKPLNSKSEISSSNGNSRIVFLGAASLSIAFLLMGFVDDDHHNRAMALGPEGPLMEEFWDNMRRYALYALTVSTGAISILLEPIIELLKNPISAVLIIAILGGGFFIVSQVVTAMVGLSDFSYEYSY